MTAHPLTGHLSVDASARRIRHYRWLEERIMRTLGGWIALTPELPVKLLFGRHVWDCAQHADLWGRRLPELRAPAHVGEPPSTEFARLLETIDARQGRQESVERVVAIYRVIKPHLAAAYAEHQADTNAIYEPPTRRILARCLDEERRHIAAGGVVLDRLARGDARRRADDWERHLRDRLAGGAGITTVAAPPAPSGAADPSVDLVALDSAFDPTVLDDDLTVAVSEHLRALIGADEATVAGVIARPVRSAVVDLYRAAGPVADAAVVACARIGDYRIVKLALRGTPGLSVIQLEWRRENGQWRIVAGDIVRSEPRDP